MTTRKELIEAIGARYRAGSILDRSAILDEFVALTGYHRKHAIRVLGSEPELERPAPLPRNSPLSCSGGGDTPYEWLKFVQPRPIGLT